MKIVPYDPAWPMIFEAERHRIVQALGALALAIDHVGSTAVPGLAAKPVVDIHLAVPASSDECAYRAALEAAGFRFVHREPAWFEHRLFKRIEPEVNLHVFSFGCQEMTRCRLFRDWLRVSRSDRDLYARTKRALAAHAWSHVEDYARAKTEVIREIMSRAEP